MMNVACVGILVADVIVDAVENYPKKGELLPVNSITVHNGGNAMTASINLKKLGVSSSMVGKIGNDMFGNYLKGVLESKDVDITGLKIDNNVQTSVSAVIVDGDGERSFLHCCGTNNVFSIKDIDWDVIEKADLVFVTGTFIMNTFDGDETTEFLKKCKELGKTTFLDVCWDASGRWGKLLDGSMPYIDYFMPSIDEAICIADEKDVDKIAKVFFEKGVGNVVIKMGSKGCFVQEKGNTANIYPCYKVNAVDTIGAGDSFCSGFLAAFARGKSLDFCAKFANAVAAHCVMGKGATSGIKTYDEIIDFMNNNKTN